MSECSLKFCTGRLKKENVMNVKVREYDHVSLVCMYTRPRGLRGCPEPCGESKGQGGTEGAEEGGINGGMYELKEKGMK